MRATASTGRCVDGGFRTFIISCSAGALSAMFGCASVPNILNVLRIGADFFWLLDSALLKFNETSLLSWLFLYGTSSGYA